MIVENMIVESDDYCLLYTSLVVKLKQTPHSNTVIVFFFAVRNLLLIGQLDFYNDKSIFFF